VIEPTDDRFPGEASAIPEKRRNTCHYQDRGCEDSGFPQLRGATL
jgi:hypothetical protein